MSRAVRLGLGGAVVAAALLLAFLAAPDDRDVAQSPHAARLSAGELDRILRATDAAAQDVPRATLEARGRELFTSSEVALDGESCGGCHTLGGANPEIGTIVHPIEPGDFTGPRDPPALYGVGETAPYGWAGDVPTLQQFVANAVALHFDNPGDTGEAVAAITAYLETIEAPRSANDRGRLSAAARRGEEIFVGQGGCIGCHGGPDFTDNSLHVLAPPPPGGFPTDGSADCGATNPDCPPADPLTGAFNTPTLRNLKQTAPYFHDGEFERLIDVVDFYNQRALAVFPQGLGLSPEQMSDLVAYLESL